MDIVWKKYQYCLGYHAATYCGGQLSSIKRIFWTELGLSPPLVLGFSKPQDLLARWPWVLRVRQRLLHTLTRGREERAEHTYKTTWREERKTKRRKFVLVWWVLLVLITQL